MYGLECLAAANYITANTPEHSSYATYGGVSAINTMTPDRRPAARLFYAFDELLRSSHTMGRRNFELFMRDLEANAPKYFAWLSPQRMKMRPEIEAYLRERYTPVETIQNGSVRLYERKP